MAALSSSLEFCALHRSLSKLLAPSSGSPRVKYQSEPLYVVSLERYDRDPTFCVHFPDSISISDCLFDATLSDGDCRIRVSLDTTLNPLVHRNKLHCGSVVRNVVFSAVGEREGGGKTFHIWSLDVDSACRRDEVLRVFSTVNVDTLPWLMMAEPNLVPLRAHRRIYLPLWNNHDFTGDVWKHTPPSETIEEDSEEEDFLEGNKLGTVPNTLHTDLMPYVGHKCKN